MPRVLAICRDPAFRQKLAQALKAEGGFVVSTSLENTTDVLNLRLHFRPDLFVLEAPISQAVLETIVALKRATPKTPLFLITDRPNMQSEKEALVHGADAVFAKGSDFASLILNARAVCGRH